MRSGGGLRWPPEANASEISRRIADLEVLVQAYQEGVVREGDGPRN